MIPKKDGIFELGLVMAGAISAGAYTAGVVDFLLEALEAWEKEKRAGLKAVLKHEVRIKVLTGASAGGMTAAVLAAALGSSFEPVNNLHLGATPNRQNPLYTSWVERVDAASLLTTDDLTGGEIASLLSCSKLDAVSEEFMVPKLSPGYSRPYFADNLDIYLTLGNLDGIPYKVPFKGAGEYGHQMVLHKDYAHFIRYQGKEPAYDSAGDFPHFLDPADAHSEEWEFFRTTALATGAFPLALAPRFLERSTAEFSGRKWLVPKSVTHAAGSDYIDIRAAEQFVEIDRDRLGQDDMKSLTLNVDGGTFDNEPIELARRCLAGSDLINPRGAAEAHRAVVLIDPFPKDGRLPQENVSRKQNLLTLAGKLFGAMKDNSRFKPDELVLAQDRDCYSRFLIGPIREGATLNQSPIACGCLGGFSGFLSRLFRQHDFQLGRRNCQAFLWKYFTIPLDSARQNPVFSPNATNLEKFAYEVDAPDGGTERVVPIIPLMDTVHPEHGAEVKPLPWSGLAFSENDLGALRQPLINRAKKLGSILLKDYVKDCLAKLVADWIASAQYPKLADWILDNIRSDLGQNGLMPPY